MQQNLFDKGKELLTKLAKNRAIILMLIFVVLFVILLGRLFGMQIIKGESYQNTFTASIKKTITVDGIRGNIYDRNGVLLAYNKLAYKLTIADTGVYSSTDEKDAALNHEMDTILTLLHKNGDEIDNQFHISMDPTTYALSYDVSGTALLRFKADVFGYARTNELSYNRKLKFNEKEATEQQIYDYLQERYGINAADYEDPYRAYEITVLRYELGMNSYQKYLSTTIARDISDESVADMHEFSDTLTGISVENDTKRVYLYPEYFSGIIGYTGTISTEEYEQYSAEDDSYSLSDIVGKSGIEQMMETQLRGSKGSQEVYVNNVGKVLKVIGETPSTTGNDVYLSLDAEMQKTIYDLLEKEIAGILYSSIRNEHHYEEDEGHEYTAVYDVYQAILTNNILHTDAFASAAEDSAQARIYDTFVSHREEVLSDLSDTLNGSENYEDLSESMQDYVMHTVEMLQNREVFDKEAVDSYDDVYQEWKSGAVSVSTYLKHAIDAGWIDSSALNVKGRYSDTDEIYEALVAYIMDVTGRDSSFDKIIYRYLVLDDEISPRDICLSLYEQGILAEDGDYTALQNGTLGSYEFVCQKIRSLEITPGQLGLDPCSGSCVVIDPRTGDLLACVSYPGYDTNRLSDANDTEYYNQLLTNASAPLYNYATQQTTAPGSTFKPVTALAGLTEQAISTGTEIHDEGVYTRLDMNLKCWIYPGNHGDETVVSALKDSCNYFFCEVGYLLSLKNGEYNESEGLEKLTDYAQAFGLGQKTGIEIPESTAKVATEYPISAAIGQSNNSFTTIQLSRYAAALANNGTVYDLTVLDHVSTPEGETLQSYAPSVANEVTDISDASYSAVRDGMRQVVTSHTEFDDIEDLKLAGKTGTAEEAKNRPNHALFIGYAPYDAPEVAIAARIAYGHSSANACDFVDDVMKLIFGLESGESLLEGGAASVNASDLVTD